ncbi:MAG: hypothetical protein ABW219_17030 [Ilumatobacteraceae bacterium]
MERSYTDLSWLEAETELKLEILEPGFEIRPIVAPATWLYDAQLGWIEDDGSLIFHDIGGQGEPGWDPEKGHGSTWRLHRDDRLEVIVPPGASGRAMLMSPMRSPASFGEEYGERIFLLGQLRPGRNGAHNTHGVFWVPPGASTAELFAVASDSGVLNHGKSGALVSPGWGADGTPEEGMLFVVSMFNCTMYKVDRTRRIWPWVVGDGEHGTVQFMPREVFRAPASWGALEGELIVAGVKDHHFGAAAPMPGDKPLAEVPVQFVVTERGEGLPAELTPVEDDLPIPPSARYGFNRTAPDSFGPFGGHQFRTTLGSVNLMQTTMMPDGPLPYDAQILRVDKDGKEHVFAEKLQAGYASLIFQGDRMVVSRIGKSYSTGDFHYPDGSLYEIVYVG